MESAFGEHMIKCVILNDDNNDHCIIGTDFLAHLDIHPILNFKENYVKIQDVKLLLKVITTVWPLMKLFLSATCDKVLEEIPEEERVSFLNDKSDTFSHIEEIEAEQLVRQPQPSQQQPSSGRKEVRDLARPIFLVAQASVSISRNCQQWVTGTIFPLTSASIPHLIVQPLSNNQVAMEFPIETAIVNVTNGTCPLLVVNNTPNSTKLQPNQLLAKTLQHTLETVRTGNDLHIAPGCFPLGFD
uniref:Uncharacterized protein n=1 Tax=Romanomermis culicivorax TaxID=13658 RepID=A0A915JIE2_ROMCU